MTLHVKLKLYRMLYRTSGGLIALAFVAGMLLCAPAGILPGIGGGGLLALPFALLFCFGAVRAAACEEALRHGAALYAVR